MSNIKVFLNTKILACVAMCVYLELYPEVVGIYIPRWWGFIPRGGGDLYPQGVGKWFLGVVDKID